MSKNEDLRIPQRIADSIRMIRGHKVILDSDLAALYGVSTKALIQAVKRNTGRFPPDFMFQLTLQDVASLRSQTVTLRSEHGQHRKYLPYAFTEQGVAMLSSVLRSPGAILANVEIMRAFVRLRQLLESDKELSLRLDALEQRYDAQFKSVFDAIRQLMAPLPTVNKAIGFKTEKK